MSVAEREAYERESVRQTRAVLETWNEEHHRQVKNVSLDGSYPETAIVVRYWDPHRGLEETKSYKLWRSSTGSSPLFVGDQGNQESPDQVGLLIATWVQGG